MWLTIHVKVDSQLTNLLRLRRQNKRTDIKMARENFDPVAQANRISLLKPGLYIGRKDRKQMFENMFFMLYRYDLVSISS